MHLGHVRQDEKGRSDLGGAVPKHPSIDASDQSELQLPSDSESVVTAVVGKDV